MTFVITSISTTKNMDIEDIDRVRELLDSFTDVKLKLERLDNILGTDRNVTSKRNISGFLVSPELYYSIYSQIKAEYEAFYEELRSKIE